MHEAPGRAVAPFAAAVKRETERRGRLDEESTASFVGAAEKELVAHKRDWIARQQQKRAAQQAQQQVGQQAREAAAAPKLIDRELLSYLRKEQPLPTEPTEARRVLALAR